MIDPALAARGKEDVKTRDDPEVARLIRSGYAALQAGDDHLAEELFSLAFAAPCADPLIYGGRAEALKNLGRLGTGAEILEQGIARYPGNANLRLQRALLALGGKYFEEGWREYEARLMSPQRCYARLRSFPRWQGEDLESKRLLVWGEQGFGDEIMFASCYPDVLARGAALTIECAADLAPLFARSFPGMGIVPRALNGEQPVATREGDFDFECPAGSLPALLRCKIRDFPVHRGYLTAEPLLFNRLMRQFRSQGDAPVIGIAWRGGTKQTRAAARSLSLARLLAALPLNSALVSLQYRLTESEADVLGELGAWFSLRDAGPTDFEQIAAATAACDVVVSVCSTAVHLAGALGRPCLALAPHVPEWRYGFYGSMPWYPSVTVLRQRLYADWPGTLSRVRPELGRLLGKPLVLDLTPAA